MIVVVGLGNPGEKYKNTRHNIGFRVTGFLAEKFKIEGKYSSRFDAIVGKGEILTKETLIVQPQTYMNISGEAVSKILNWHKVDTKSFLVVYDDISLDFGRIRFRASGSAGGHNGIKSIIASCGTENFARLKIGIGPNPGEHLWKNYVLQEFSFQEQKYLQALSEFCVDAAEVFIDKGIDEASNKFNGINILDSKSKGD
jgi:peptidyl-tRNA hydrolase, PTH1 family